ncbi:MAG: hypothetical protein DHS20C06_01300 [Hyphobacterium sp.]|nr:MAG: hypothetical protein DHS20C06_01300 [Hyphobacterium sp.]
MAVASDGRGGQTVAVTAGNYLGDPNITPSAGGFIPLSPRELGVVQGHSLRVSFFVEAAPGSDVDLVNVGVFQRGIGQNGWELHEFPPQNEPIIVTVTPPQCEAEYGFFGVWPSAIGEPGVLHLNRIHVEILEPLDCGERS